VLVTFHYDDCRRQTGDEGQIVAPCKDTPVATAESDENNLSCSHIRCRWSLLMLTHLSHDVSSWLSGSLDGVSYGNRPAYITFFRTSGTPLSQTDYATQKHLSQCRWKLKNFAIHLYRTVSDIIWLTQLLRITYYLQTAVTDIGHYL